VAQNLTAEEREGLVRASNEYIGAAGEEDYADEVNALMDYLRRVQRELSRARASGFRSGKPRLVNVCPYCNALPAVSGNSKTH